MKKVLSILSNLRQPSTWAGVAVLLTLFGVSPLHVEVLGQGVNALAALAAAVAVVLPDAAARAPKPPEQAASGPHEPIQGAG